jgi:hypothetical protein
LVLWRRGEPAMRLTGMAAQEQQIHDRGLFATILGEEQVSIPG